MITGTERKKIETNISVLKSAEQLHFVLLTRRNYRSTVVTLIKEIQILGFLNTSNNFFITILCVCEKVRCGLPCVVKYFIGPLLFKLIPKKSEHNWREDQLRFPCFTGYRKDPGTDIFNDFKNYLNTTCTCTSRCTRGIDLKRWLFHQLKDYSNY